MFKPSLFGRMEALLFASGDPLSNAKIALVMEMEQEAIPELINQLGQQYESEARGLHIRRVAGGYQLTTKPSLNDVVRKLVEQQELKLSNAAMETLAIIAFKQPVTRSEMEAVRGVKVDGVVNTLLDSALIAEAGRKDTIGHPILYVTTDLFLTTFGLDTLQDLPDIPEEILAEKKEEVQEGALFSEDGKVLEMKDKQQPDAKPES